MQIRRMIMLSLIDIAKAGLLSAGYTFTFVPKNAGKYTKEIVLPGDFTDATREVSLPAGDISLSSRRSGRKTGIGSMTEFGYYLTQIVFYAESSGQLMDLMDVFDELFKKDMTFSIYDFTATGWPTEAALDPSYHLDVQSPRSQDISTFDENVALRNAGLISFMGEVVT